MNQPESTPEKPPTGKMIFVPGMAAGAGIYLGQEWIFPDWVSLEWVAPHTGESLAGYGARWAEELKPLSPRVVGGMSFGGIVALELAKHLQPDVVILISSVRSPEQMPLRIRCLRPFRGLIPLLPLGLFQAVARFISAKKRLKFMPGAMAMLREFGACDRDLLRWSMRAILEWKSAPAIECPILQIHGDRDFIFPLSRISPDCVIAGGGHVLSCSHTAELNRWLRSYIT